VRASRTFDDVPAGKLYHVAPADGRLFLAGSGGPANRNDFDGWLVRLRSPSSSAIAVAPSQPPSSPGPRPAIQPQQPGTLSGDLGTLDDKHPQIATASRIGAGETSRYAFALPIAGWVEVALVPENGDADLVLLGSDGRAPLISANSGTATEFISASLGAGTYTLDVVGNTESSFRLVLRRGPSNKPSEAAVAMDKDWDIDERRRIERGLELLGYGPGEADGLFTAATREAIRAFQASLWRSGNRLPRRWRTSQARRRGRNGSSQASRWGSGTCSGGSGDADDGCGELAGGRFAQGRIRRQSRSRNPAARGRIEEALQRTMAQSGRHLQP